MSKLECAPFVIGEGRVPGFRVMPTLAALGLKEVLDGGEVLPVLVPIGA
jgi:hypothetical protein